jgi:hypothetical protein
MFAESMIASQIVFKPWYVQRPAVFLHPERECTHCHDWWPLDSEFWFVFARDPQGFTKQCKACLSEKRSLKIAENKPAVRKVKSVIPGEKICSGCQISKKVNSDNFMRHAGRNDGYQSQCKPCLKERARASNALKRQAREQEKLLLKASTPKPAARSRKRKSVAKVALLLSA